MDYHSPTQCLATLQKLPTDTADRFLVLASIVTGLFEAKPAPRQHFEVLEKTRPLIEHARNNLTQLDTDQPLPPDSQHNALLDKVIKLWREFSASYGMIAVQSAKLGVLEDQRALFAQRQVYYTGKIIYEYYRVHRTLPPGLWKEVHSSFTAAEQAHVAHIRVSDPLNTIWKAQSALEAYITILLLDLANPFSRTGHEWLWIYRWAERFAPYCTLDPNITGRKPTTYGLDLASDHGLRPLGLLIKGSNLHYFDCNKLASQIQSVFAQFKQGVSPLSLGLGNDCSAEACAHLLLSLYRPWGLASAGRRFPRRGTNGLADLCTEWLAIGFYIQGKLFEQPHRNAANGTVNTHHDFKQLHAEGERLGLICEKWKLIDQSVGGFRLQQHPQAERLKHHQLVGMRPPGGECFLLGQVSWLMFREDGLLEAGIHVLTGLPQTIAVRSVSTQSDGPQTIYSLAFLIDANETLHIAASLVLPVGWYRPNGILDAFHAGHNRKLYMTQLLLKGSDFEQVAFLDRPEV
ncbi:MAG: hypothetical protein LBB76_06295 [Azoarcus sp.]|jgi:hypothetical protein|nr:hypothetical protein [Azoarcus sp.]